MGENPAAAPSAKKQPYWVMYLGILLAGLIMLAQAAHYHPMQRVPAKLAIGLIYSAAALFISDGRPPGYVGTAVIWAAIVLSFLV